jgi:NAD(P)-dependent dehydrogenase (short-subunit alcohol dehydrogenase family)
MSAQGWTPEQVGDLSGRTAVVTGGNSGIGLEAAIELARHGAHVVITSRDAARGEQALRQLRSKAAAASAEVWGLDLADLASVRRFAERLAAGHDRLDLLVNNAGVMAVPRSRTTDGFEMQIGTNHLGHFALTGRVLPLLLAGERQTRDVRVVTLSSNAHRVGKLSRDDLMREHGYQAWGAYGRSKLANLLFTHELQRRLQDAGSSVKAVAAHPGLAGTNLVAAGPMTRAPGPLRSLASGITKLVGQSAALGAWPTLRAATDPDVEGGEYFGPSWPGQWRGAPVQVDTSPAAQSLDDARWLWEESVRLTGVRYDVLENSTVPPTEGA